PGESSGTKSPGGTMFTIGTLIMMRVPVSVERAVAAWPAPMLATSRSASRRAVLRSVVLPSPAGVLRGLVISEETGGVNDESGRSIAKNGRSAEESLAGIHTVELLDDDFLLTDELVDDERCTPLRELDEYDLAACGDSGCRQADALTQPDGGKKIVPDGDDLPSLRLEQHWLREAERLEDVRQ